ncbi:MAG: hypothetical protein JKY00_00365 [Roseicyclus sp.]|nr:hypothetical protein [Roseicyclus sp.]
MKKMSKNELSSKQHDVSGQHDTSSSNPKLSTYKIDPNHTAHRIIDAKNGGIHESPLGVSLSTNGPILTSAISLDIGAGRRRSIDGGDLSQDQLALAAALSDAVYYVYFDANWNIAVGSWDADYMPTEVTDRFIVTVEFADAADVVMSFTDRQTGEIYIVGRGTTSIEDGAQYPGIANGSGTRVGQLMREAAQEFFDRTGQSVILTGHSYGGHGAEEAERLLGPEVVHYVVNVQGPSVVDSGTDGHNAASLFGRSDLGMLPQDVIPARITGENYASIREAGGMGQLQWALDGVGNRVNPPHNYTIDVGIHNSRAVVEHYGNPLGLPPRSTQPILLDLDGLGLSVTELDASTVYLDSTNDGLLNRTAWAGVGNGVLFFDADASGDISSTREYVFTEWDPTAATDLEALASVFDTNGDGKLTAADDDFASFKVMVTQADGSLVAKTLAELNIVSIDLTGNATQIELPYGSGITSMTTFTYANGDIGAVGSLTLQSESQGHDGCCQEVDNVYFLFFRA